MEKQPKHHLKSIVVVLPVVSIGLVLLLTGCTGRGRAPMTVRIGYEAILSDYTYFVAAKEGYFEQEGLKVEAVQFNNTNDQTLALLAGQVDMIPNSSLALLLAAETEKPGRFQVFMAHGDLGNKILVRGDSPVTSIEQLAGARMGTYPGTTMLTYATLALSRYFEGSKLPELIGMPPPSLVEALTTGQLDAIFPVEPIVSVALQEGGARGILDNPLGNIMMPFPGGASALRVGFVEESPQAAAAVVRAMNRAVDFIRKHDTESRAVLAEYTGVPLEVLEPASLGYISKLDEIDRDAIQTFGGILAKAGVIDREVDTTKWYYSLSH